MQHKLHPGWGFRLGQVLVGQAGHGAGKGAGLVGRYSLTKHHLFS